jgi:hypothetical protein
MADRHDPVDRALEHIKSCAWTGSTRSRRIEEAIMHAHSNRRTPRRGQLIAIAVVLCGAGVVTAAITGFYPRLGRSVAPAHRVDDDGAPAPDDADIRTPRDEFEGAEPSTAGS